VSADLRLGSRGEGVRDLQQRLSALHHGPVTDEPGEFASGTEAAVRAFQDARGLRTDGVVGRQTWAAIVESGFALGDRLLYLRRPMQRGDDVVELQRRLNALGFDAGREDGIFGPDTHRALLELQRSVGLAVDAICGSTTIAALDRVGSFAEGSIAELREKERWHSGPRRLAERRIYLAVAPGLAVLGEQVARGLGEAGAEAVLDTAGDDDSLVAAEANRFGAELFLAIRTGDEAGCRCAYFASGRFRSEAGWAVAHAVHEELGAELGTEVEVVGKAYAVLRETRMAAVVCEILPAGDIGAMRELVAAAGRTGRAVVRGVRRGVEHPPDAPA